MTALAAQADVETVLGRTLTAAEVTALPGALAKASRVVRAVTGRRYEAGTFTVRRRTWGGQAVLDCAPTTVDEIVYVNADGTETELTDWTLRGDLVYGLCPRWVEVTYTVDEPVVVPPEVVGVCAALAARSLTSSAPEGAESWTETRGPFTDSASFGAGGFDSAELSKSEAQALARYALRRLGPLTSIL